MELADLQAALLGAIAELRLPSSTAYCSLLHLAERLGVTVEFHFHDTPSKSQARVEMATRPPRIAIYRKAGATGTRALGSHEEHLLTARERFSVAHELGHWLAFSQYGIHPVDSATSSSAYWQQERVVDAFAGALLVPDSVADGWLSSETDNPLPALQLRQWSLEARVSEEVVATRLCQRRAGLGFIKFGRTVRRADQRRALLVLFSSYSADLPLPNRGAHVISPALEAALDHPDGRCAFSELAIGDRIVRDLAISWRQKLDRKESIQWASLARIGSPGRQLTLDL